MALNNGSVLWLLYGRAFTFQHLRHSLIGACKGSLSGYADLWELDLDELIDCIETIARLQEHDQDLGELL